jgi:hypothetical protein
VGWVAGPGRERVRAPSTDACTRGHSTDPIQSRATRL